MRWDYILGHISAKCWWILLQYGSFWSLYFDDHVVSPYSNTFEYSNEQGKEWGKFEFLKVAHPLEALPVPHPLLPQCTASFRRSQRARVRVLAGIKWLLLACALHRPARAAPHGIVVVDMCLLPLIELRTKDNGKRKPTQRWEIVPSGKDARPGIPQFCGKIHDFLNEGLSQAHS